MRRPDWRERLEALILERASTPFAWGSNDCATFARDAVLAQTGLDLWAPTHTDERGALRALQGFNGYKAAVTRFLGNPIPAMRAETGDVVLFEQRGRETLGVCLEHRVIAPGPGGLESVPLGGICAWMV